MKPAQHPPIYLDVCALERQYDDQRYYRIRIETEAVELIMAQVRTGAYTLYYSPVHDEEIPRNSNEMRCKELMLLLKTLATYAKPHVKDADALERRGWQLEATGLGIADAFHVAYAEAVGADLVSCDDELIARSRRGKIKVWCGTPVDFCKKEKLL